MVDVKAPPPRDYINVMELLVAEEVEQQLRQLPTRVLKYVKAVEVETYALNRLPSLYAASEKGWQSQYQKAKRELHKEIRSSVRQAIAAVQIDPLRASQPLARQWSPSSPNGALLEQFRAALGQPNLTWESLLRKCKRAGAAQQATMHQSHHQNSSLQYSAGHGANDHPAAVSETSYAQPHQPEHHGTVWRPGTYGETSWHPKRNHGYRAPKPPSVSENYDWNDSRYR
ncbi:MAG: late competence development ComFB family protein [Cyanobacteria bacterium P01_D01_bin.156]